jgi:FkbM family methyltransferase
MRRSPLMNAAGFARAIEEAYRVMWRKWCSQQPSSPAFPPPVPVHSSKPPEAAAKNSPPKARGKRRFTLYDFFDDVPDLKVIDVGASPIDEQPPYQKLFDAGHIELVGFEPDPDQYRALVALNRRRATYLPHAIGDGAGGVLHICKAPGMTSLLEPDMEILRHFHGFADWGTVLRTVPVQTEKLDDIAEAESADYLKMDLQGGELGVLRGAAKILQKVLVVQVEAQFVPFYKNQPLFAELDQALRQAGFLFHEFLTLHSRVFLPMMINNSVYAGLKQQLWSDAVYVKRFTDFGNLGERELLKIAVILNDLYGSIDLCALALQHADRQANTKRMDRYMEALVG